MIFQSGPGVSVREPFAVSAVITTSVSKPKAHLPELYGKNLKSENDRNAMQDLKHLSNKKKFSIFSNTGRNCALNRANRSALPPFFKSTNSTHSKRRQRFRDFLLFISIVTLLTPLFLLSFHYFPPLLKSLDFTTSAKQTTNVAEAVSRPPASSFSAANALLGSADESGNSLRAKMPNGDTIHYSILPRLQKRVHDYMASNRVPYGVFVAIEPSTGRILAMTSYSSVSSEWQPNAFFDLYPMASLFKIVTASAALESRKITPDTVIEFRGNSYSENPKYWETSRRGRNNRMDVTIAMGKSVNPVYGRVAADIAGKPAIMSSVDRFGFNQTLLSGIPVKESRADEPESELELMRMGAGLDHDVRISPIHAAAIMAAIANQGTMMQPALTDMVSDSRGNIRESHTPRSMRRLISPETALSLGRMLSTSVTSGTSRRAFHDRHGRPLLNIDIAAKTGSINGADPEGHHSWFAAYAPIQNPKIALVALVINHDRWKIKSSSVGEQALAEFFRENR